MHPDTSKTAPTPSGDDSGVRKPAAASTDDLLTVLTPLFDSAFAPFPHIVLAVSGGSDSIAVMHLVAAWRRLRAEQRAVGISIPSVSVVTVDHALRANSAAEARKVAGAAAQFGFPHTTLTWVGDKPHSGLQAAARAARYALIERHVKANNWQAVATAHTADDQAETVLMRLARGSGVDGLGAMRGVTALDGGTIVLRPLLGVRKTALTTYLQEAGIGWDEDPSNGSTDFERVRIRRALSALRTSGFELDAMALGRTATRAARAADALDWMTAQTWANRQEHARFDPLGYAVVEWAWLTAQPEDIRLRLLAGLVDCIGGQGERVSLGQLEALTIGRGWRLPAGVTLHDTHWDNNGHGRLRIFREAGRRSLPTAEVPAPGFAMTWDGRFTILRCGAGPGLDAGALEMGPLEAGGLGEIEARGWQRIPVPARVLWSLPTVRAGGSVVAVPPLGYALLEFAGAFHCDAITPRFAT